MGQSCRIGIMQYALEKHENLLNDEIIPMEELLYTELVQ